MKKNIIIIIIIYLFSYSAQIHTISYNQFNHTEMCTFLRNFFKPNDLVFDVGANIGKKAELYLECGAKVVCIEPQPECVQILHTKFKNNHNVHIEPIGLAQKEGTLNLFKNDEANTISSFSQEWVTQGRFAVRNYTWNQQIEVPVSTLDALIKKHGVPQFCKIDVENFEFEVLQGLSQPIKFLSFEFNSEFINNTKKCIMLLTSLGYTQFNFAPGERGLFLFSKWMPADAFFEALQKKTVENTWNEIWGLWGDIYAKYEPRNRIYRTNRQNIIINARNKSIYFAAKYQTIPIPRKRIFYNIKKYPH